MVLVLSRSRSVTPAEGAYDRTDYPSYNYLNSGRPPKILESPLDSKSLLSGMIIFFWSNKFFIQGVVPYGLGVKVRNMKMDFNIYGTWRRVGQ